MRPLKPSEKKRALNLSSSMKRMHKESARPPIIKASKNHSNLDDEYENPSLNGSLLSDDDSINKVYVNFA